MRLFAVTMPDEKDVKRMNLEGLFTVMWASGCFNNKNLEKVVNTEVNAELPTTIEYKIIFRRIA